MRLCGITFMFFAHLPIMALLGSAADGQTLTWGSLVTDSGPKVYDWMLQDWIDEFFEDGSRGDGTVDSTILIVATQCYGGNWLDNFNSLAGFSDGGAAFDTVGFANTTILSATRENLRAYYGGYDDDAARALMPSSTVQQLHNAGTNGKHPLETPVMVGSNRIIGGSTSTHVLVWSGDPEARDRQQINTVANNFSSATNTTVTVLAGDGTAAQGTSNVDGAATLDNLKQAIQDVGALMDDGADEQFVMFITDHGNIEKIDTTATIVSSASFGNYNIQIDPPLLDDWIDDPDNFPEVEVWTSTFEINPRDVPNIEVKLNGIVLGTLDDFDFSVIELPDNSFMDVYTLQEPLLEDSLDPFLPSQQIELFNSSSADYTFQGALIGSGAISKVPEPSALALAALTIFSLSLFRKLP